MKNLSILIIALFLCSCCGTKKVIGNQPKQITKVETPKQQSETPKIIPLKEDNSTIETPTEAEEEEEEEEETIVELGTPLEAFDHSIYNTLLKKHVTEEGNVDYKGIKNERSILSNYINSLGKNLPENKWTKEDKLAYWINAYNAMTIDLIIRNYPIKSIKDIKKPWEQRLWKLGKKWYNLNEIEHQILRKMDESRIHFALVCAAVSCPKLQNKAFTATTLENDLAKLTREFMADTTKNNISTNSLKLSKIFNWFSKDFKQNGSLIDFLNQYANVEISKNAKKRFNDYNWDLNE